MSVYSATRAHDLNRCLASLSEQTLPADEIVLVRDGPVDSTVENCIQKYESTLPFHHLHFPKNRGLGPALHDGLKICCHELVARVDSDDWSVPHRFQTQAIFLERESTVSVVGGWLREWHHWRNDVFPLVRRSPLEGAAIQFAAKSRNPINHPTVMFRKSHVLGCGNYESCPRFEDYFLWAKMLVHGHLLQNLPEVLVETNVNLNYFKRRGGLDYVRDEIRLVRKLTQIGFLSTLGASAFLASRLPMRLLPNAIRQYLYITFLRDS